MIGTISKAFVEALRASDLADQYNISVVLANDEGESTVQTALPFVAVSVRGDDNRSGTYIGGALYNTYEVRIAVVTHFDNQNASEDLDIQYDLMDLHYKVMRYLNRAKKEPFFIDLMQGYDFSAEFKGVETVQQRGQANELEIEVFFHRLIYSCYIIDKQSICDRPGAPLEDGGINIELEDVVITEGLPADPNRGRTGP